MLLSPRSGRPRSRRAARIRWTLPTSDGANDRATTTATPTSYSAAGSDASSRRGFASAFAAPMQARIVASRSPSVAATTTPSVVTGPPTDTPAAQPGRSSDGSVNSTVPAEATPNTTWATRRIASTTSPSFRNTT